MHLNNCGLVRLHRPTPLTLLEPTATHSSLTPLSQPIPARPLPSERAYSSSACNSINNDGVDLVQRTSEERMKASTELGSQNPPHWHAASTAATITIVAAPPPTCAAAAREDLLEEGDVGSSMQAFAWGAEGNIFPISSISSIYRGVAESPQSRVSEHMGWESPI